MEFFKTAVREEPQVRTFWYTYSLDRAQLSSLNGSAKLDTIRGIMPSLEWISGFQGSRILAL